jgi:hypothetical protein
MAKLWRTLVGQRTREAARYIDPDSVFGFNGIQYVVRPGQSPDAKVEDIDNSFAEYVQEAYKASGPIFAVILARMLLFSEARFCWFEVGDNGEDGRPAGREGLELLENPWPNAGTGELLARAEQDVSLGGNFYAVREQGRLRRLRPDWLTIVLSAPPGEAVDSDVAGYWYHPGRRFPTVTEPEPGDPVYLPDEVMHWSPIPDPDAQYRGMSWLTPVVGEILADKAATRHKQQFFTNGATLGAIISSKENLTTEQFKEWKDNLLEAHQGVNNAYKPMFLASPVDTNITTADMRQLDFKVTQGAGETRLCAAGGVPPIIVGLSEGLQSATYSNYGMARRKFGDHWGIPQWKSFAHAAGTVVDPPPREGLRLGVNTAGIAFLREDAKDAAEIAQIQASTLVSLVQGGIQFDSAKKAVVSGDMSLTEWTGLVSVQLQVPGANPPPATPPPAGNEPAPPAGAVRAGYRWDAIRRAWLPDLHPRDHRGRFRRVGGADLVDAIDVRKLGDKRLQSLFSDLSLEDPPHEAALGRLWDEMGRREEEAARAAARKANPLHGRDVTVMSDAELTQVLHDHPARLDVAATVRRELQLRQARADQEARQRPLVDWDVHSADTLEQRRIDKLVASGASYAEAYADAYHLSDTQLRNQERASVVDLDRRAGETRRQAVRRAYGEWTHLQYLSAENATRGNVLNAAGRAAGIDPISLFSGPAPRARKYASEELLRWWGDNSRVNFGEFEAAVLTGDTRLLSDAKARGNGQEFGV